MGWAVAAGPTAQYEPVGDVPGVVFPCGMIHDPGSGLRRQYDGAARLDDVISTLTTGGATLRWERS
jgi:predicted GH43/DUF377 family glycosyl hydrolase